MKKYINKKSVIEKGGLMIEALAMLGLIAVVTPTMYKKSAERTMEVEDINTASSIRSYMNSWNDLVAAHYIDIMEVMGDEDGAAPEEKIMTLDELSTKVKELDPTLDLKGEFEKYLPYGYKADKDLYNYGKPEFAVARSGNNLTAFMVFPSKTQGDDSIGQERTVRIASLIGSNGGYVRGDKARGVGGTWSLDSTQLGKISSDKGEYSIVTSSVDAINSSTGGMGQDNEKYLQRTAENGELWRNMMHTDIYMGNLEQTSGDNQYGDDRIDPDTKGFFSIRNINQLIVGADGHPADSENDVPADENLAGLYVHNDGSYAHKTGDQTPYEFKNYALYVADNNTDEHGVNAYIAGSLEAAAKKFFVDEGEMMYDGPRIQLGNYKDESNLPHYLINARTSAATQGASGTNTTAANVVKLLDGQLVVSDSNLGAGDGFGAGEVSETNQYNTQILAATGGFKGADRVEGKSSLVGSDGNKVDIAVKYNQEQTFPVMVDSNMIVNGVMAAGQVDAQHIRSATLSTGSEKIDDKVKWMDVDKDGIHIRNRDGVTPADGTKVTSAKSQVEINKDVMAMRFDNTAKALKDDANFTEHSSQVLMDQYGIEMRVRDTDGTTERKIGVGTDTMRMEMEKNEMRIGGQATTVSNNTLTETNFGETNDANVKQYRVEYKEGGHVDMVGTTLQVTDSSNRPVFTINGNDSKEKDADFKGTKYNDAEIEFDANGKRKNTAFKIAGHGNTVFTSDDTHEEGGIYSPKKFLAMGVDKTADSTNMSSNQYNAAVNIVANTTNGSEKSGQRVLYIDLDNSHDRSFVSGTSTKAEHGVATLSSPIDNSGKATTYMPEGSVYIRKGLIELTPNYYSDHSKGDAYRSANTASATIRASRFVANNYDANGNRVTYTNPITEAAYKDYNGVDKSTAHPYDTYMVNPAYTSVMKDIKLTSRLGARLSDILPDFIVKAIYVSRNAYLEKDAELKFTDWDSAKEEGSYHTNSESGYTNLTWASPYLGRVVAPQCPPGYGRVISMVPREFHMAQVGHLSIPTMGGQKNGSGYVVFDEPSPGTGIYNLDKTSLSAMGLSTSDDDRKKALSQVQPEFTKIMLAPGSNDPTISLKPVGSKLKNNGYKRTTDGGNDLDNHDAIRKTDNTFNVEGLTNDYGTPESHQALQSAYIDMSQKPMHVQDISNIGISRYTGTDPDYDPWLGGGEDIKNTYVLSSGRKDGLQPLTFQQSTWLKTATQQLCKNKSGSTCAGKYVQGWAVLMGFIYPHSVYGDIADNLGSRTKIEAISGSSSNSTYYWNVFPIKVGTLEAQITTYCYFDNKIMTKGGSSYHLTNDVNWTGSDSYEYNYKEPNESFVPNAANKTYRQKLNDPALKYDELW